MGRFNISLIYFTFNMTSEYDLFSKYALGV